METVNWIAAHWLDVLQSVGIITGFIFTAHSIRKESEARKIGNMITLSEQHHSIWKQLYERPELSRIMEKGADLGTKPPSDEERLFVTSLMLHLDTIHRAMKAGMFVQIKGIQNDIREFIELPIPKAVWKMIKPFQDEDFVRFVESSTDTR